MPRSRKRRARNQTQSHVRQLLTGADFLDNAFGSRAQTPTGDGGFAEVPGRVDYASMREAWSDLRKFLLPEFEKLNPGKTCYAARLFDSNEKKPDTSPISGLNVTPIVNLFPV